MSEFFRPKLITNLMVEGVLMAEQGKIDKYGPVEPPATVEAANSNDGGSVKPSELAKVYSVAALGVAEATAAKRPPLRPGRRCHRPHQWTRSGRRELGK